MVLERLGKSYIFADFDEVSYCGQRTPEYLLIDHDPSGDGNRILRERYKGLPIIAVSYTRSDDAAGSICL